MIKVTFVRHGTTHWMEQGRLHGKKDSSLSQWGKQEAKDTAKWIKGKQFDNFYTSPSGRAFQTAEIISEFINQKPIPILGLRERSFGILEGRKIPNIVLDSGKKRWLDPHFLLFFLAGEPLPSFLKRVNNSFDWIINENPSKEVLIVTHNGYIAATLFNLLGNGPLIDSLQKYNSAPCGITQLEIDEKCDVSFLNRNFTGHLSKRKEKT